MPLETMMLEITGRQFMKIIADSKLDCIIKIAVCTLFFFVPYIFVLAQDKKMEDKIDPVFRNIIANEKHDDCPPSSSKTSHSKSKNNKAKNKETAASVKRYNCIVYTKNAKAIREKGIIINSTLPTFVTASATINQIVQMSTMPEVIKIEAPHIDNAH